ncbi:MAG: protease modulator HflC [Candidatus Eisenbacteria bacterium]|nr:protease modulator HflC [Candidatus Eisenbacteria bacterium]
MNAGRVITVAVLVIVGLIVLTNSLYVVDMTEQVVVTQFGDPIGDPVTEPGLHTKAPFIQKANYFDKRILEWDGNPSQIPTKDKKYIWVDTFARWRIIDPLKFMQSVSNELGAQARLDDVIDAAARDRVTNQLLLEVVRNTDRELPFVDLEVQTQAAEDTAAVTVGRTEITRRIFRQASEQMPRYGIELIDVRVKRVNYVEEVRQNVYERMISERKRIAERYRSEGQGESAEIRGQKEKELDRIHSEAYEIAEEIKGRADGEATAIYARAYGRDPDFYQFLRTLESYQETIDEESSLIITTDSEYFKLLKSMSTK